MQVPFRARGMIHFAKKDWTEAAEKTLQKQPN